MAAAHTNTAAAHKLGSWDDFSSNWPVDGGKDLSKALGGGVTAPVSCAPAQNQGGRPPPSG